MGFRSSNRRKGETEIVRMWTDSQPVIRFKKGYDGFIQEDELPICHVAVKSGEVFDIPYDPRTGTVSDVDMFQRFLDVWHGGKPGRKRNITIDINRTARINFSEPVGGWTPEALVASGWWRHPNMSDIKGIDDLRGAQNFLRLSKGKSKIESIGKKICVYASTPERKRQIEGTLLDNFTIDELKTAVKDGGIVITEGDAGRGASGCYIRRQPGVDTPRIILEKGSGEDTITHEFTHHLRGVDEHRGGIARTPMPVDSKGFCRWMDIDTKEFESMVNAEEACTVAETTIRTRKPCSDPTGYFQYTDDREMGCQRQYDEDRNVLVGDRPQIGAKAIAALENGFDKTHISSLRYTAIGERASTYLSRRRDEGSLPVPKPRKKYGKRKRAELPEAPQPPMATANRRRRF